MNIFIAIVGLAALVFVHELGHFLTALATGMRPRKFYVGFPPALLKVRRRGIEYGLGAIPLGGYVRIPGMHRPAPGDVDVHFASARAERPELTHPLERLKRALEEGEMRTAREELAGLPELVRLAKLSPAARRAAERGLRDLDDALGPDAYWRQRTWRRLAVIAAGPFTNVLLAVVLFATLYVVSSGGYRLGFRLESEPTAAIVADVQAGEPAGRMGLRSGDRIVRVNDEPVDDFADVAPLIQDSEGDAVALTVVRDGRRVRLGPERPRAIDSYSVPAAAWRSVRLTGLVTKEIFKSLGQLVTGEGREQIASPVGIVQGSSDALDEGAERYLWVLGLISLSLALLNLLPLLPLDGGHITFSIIEGIRGRSVGREIYERVSAIGIAIVLLLFFVGLSNDVGRLGE
ncbi:MAG: site-2 protease family protein [Actinomycetota bacterium]|nr:site-2 protease family protein [Actinomycetota bacterium]